MATLVALHDPSFTDGREEMRDQAFMACGLFYEHDWTANGPVGEAARAQFQRDMLTDLQSYVDALLVDAADALGDLVSDGGSVRERHLVWNPLSWDRTDHVDLQVTTKPPFHVVSVATGETLRHQPVTVDGAPRTRVLVPLAPAVGYTVVEIVPGPGTTFADAATVALPSFENGLYEVALGSRGQITSLVETISGIEWVASSLHDQGDGAGSVTIENTGPVSTTLLVNAGGSPAHETRVTLYHPSISRIDVENRITENFSQKIELSYDFAVSDPVVRHEEVGMVALARRKSQGGDYADENARVDYLTLGHFVDVSNGSRGIALSSWDSAYFRLGQSTASFLDQTSSTIHAVVGMQVDGTSLGIDAQGGDTFFRNRFSIRPHAFYSSGPVMRFALEHQNPLIGVPVTGAKGVLPAESLSLVRVAGSDAVLWALKPAEEGIDEGIVARVWNLAEAPRSISLELTGLDPVNATRTTHIETDLEPIDLVGATLTDVLARQEMRTYRIRTSGILDAGPPAPPPPSERQFAVSPLPAAVGDRVRIRFESMDATEPITVRVYDAQGREVARLADRVFGVGPHEVSWAPPPGRPLPAGLYFVVAEGPRTRITGRVLRVE
jgi:alpha-mannosidase